MFGDPKIYVYRLNPISNDLKIQSIIDQVFNTINEVNLWLKMS